MLKIQVLFFATLKDRTGQKSVEFSVTPGSTVKDVKNQVSQQFPAITPLIGNVLVSVNQNFAFDEDEVPDGAEIAFFPPVSGGSQEADRPTIFRITNDPLDLDELVQKITLPSTGAAAIFTGMVRGITRKQEPFETVSLEYEAYVPMAEAKMLQVAEEIRERWPVIEGIAIVQRIGRLEVGTPTVLIACTAAHRDTGVFDAARYGIDRLKEIVPVWKKEIGPDGQSWIEGSYIPQRGD